MKFTSPSEGEKKTFTSPSGRGRPAKRQRSRAGEGTRVDGTHGKLTHRPDGCPLDLPDAYRYTAVLV